MKIDQDRLRQWVNFLAILSAFGINIWANIAPWKGLTIGEISTTFFPNVLIIPANYAFAIWGLIYLGLISLAIYQVLSTQSNNPRFRQMGYYLAISSLSQIIWVLLFQSQLFTLSVMAMVGILIPLILLYLRLGINLTKLPFLQKWLINFPISIYFAWISVATVINIASALDRANWGGWGISSQVWTAIMMVVSATIAVTVIWQRRDNVYGGVFVWALVAIALRQIEENLTLAVIAGVLAGLLVLIIIGRKAKARRKRI
ncbi:tryptophan-rich sensory protein [Cyanobacterium stanieri LEGE 03274]|uniref:Tryptophan-rich sensory protein n=1 Tax=Cyanobacterium stanieri LEGE 03274 TaxID=1828756 RepID=A0ABR9V074_9CHRO|nr:tryptophan-rich sensory protein [Cyanobacterium stanieri]MBE9221277.1 tryptophan-rich sensory protein [Cyanobacterium stanieri LEGE 03274]